ncbi:hypothetical protein MGYG_00034 [Nannizzia gypsea CBS 118893]|uniref:Xylanolytic transcriptional activator regulatory domain-containing protein n=1 Tax=Arthroderma gypseum (strain ATCC MYA-4604 / CBS 118893) TaxID=535722 RepID=E5R2A1_ARTGP|nr:hypothetical protein MGYG_00034 [Nannizzia gypsea CBS 118893]EFQ96991.1 hypothetical protein MGYG_00034 [Nannizzia gypsea CBS 118893]
MNIQCATSAGPERSAVVGKSRPAETVTVSVCSASGLVKAKGESYYLRDGQSSSKLRADTQRSLKRLFEGSLVVVPPSSRYPVSPSRTTPQLSPQQSADPAKVPVFTVPLGRHHLGPDNDRRFFGPTALESLMLNIKDEISDIPDIESHTLKEGVLQAQRKVSLLVDQQDDGPTKGNSPPTAPPFAILDAMVEPYFATTNHHFPIWTKEKFTRMAATLRQSAVPDQDLASIICCNNLVLMAMSADSLCSNRRESLQTKQARKSSSIDSDIVEGFLTNAKRSLNNLDQLISSRLINVQALLSMYIVAQEHLSKGLSETLFALAVQCAKSIGIHQWHSFRGDLTNEDMEERRNISYCLYVLDKAVSWTAGSSPNIPATDMHFDPFLATSESSAVCCLLAKTELARIEETVYLEIYANQAKEKNEDQVRDFATMILSRLQSWLADSGIEFDKLQKVPKSSASNLQLAIRYLCVQLLLIWPHKNHPDGMFQRGQEVAKLCMRYLICLWNSSPDQGNHAVFPFFLASLPPLYLYEVLSSILCGRGSKSDIDMLQEYVEMLKAITDRRAEASYNRRLYRLSHIVTDVVNIRRAQYKRQKPTADGSTNTYPVSELLSPPTGGYKYTNSEVQENADSCFDSTIFQGADSSFAFMSPINSTTGELAREPDEFMPHLGSYSKMAPGNESFNPLAIESFRDSVFLER